MIKENHDIYFYLSGSMALDLISENIKLCIFIYIAFVLGLEFSEGFKDRNFKLLRKVIIKKII